MKKMVLSLLAVLMTFVACKTATDPMGPDGGGSAIPSGLQGKWTYGGSFSATDFWNYNGTYAGKGFEQGMVFDFKANGKFDMYVINATTSYNCRTEAYSYFTGSVTFDENAHTFTITPTSGNYRGFYSCTPGSNFKRDARADELKKQGKTYYYVQKKNSQGQTVLNVSVTPDEKDGIEFKP
ncbi:hypothetical protein [Arsenicibacter rosenii]|uniref:Lipocalin-like domain-containing protein n=1 Tax=Arsenicibacter rosenii TaxID=1750698 RepID=A0A1S2VJZ7_9BACT|nr:hypothetical protein [Arsenicibacter rosenii]OIN59091.1 hypothetical protein BLX24_12870 [Arsenicibacter rosenii]